MGLEAPWSVSCVTELGAHCLNWRVESSYQRISVPGWWLHCAIRSSFASTPTPLFPTKVRTATTCLNLPGYGSCTKYGGTLRNKYTASPVGVTNESGTLTT